MKPKTVRALYWITTILFVALMLMDGVAGVMRVQEGKDAMAHLGYPVYAMTIIGIGKLLGAVSILQLKFRTLKEWAYAGFTVNFIGAAMSHAYSGDGIGMICAPLIMLVLMFITYYFWKRLNSFSSSI